MENNTDSTRVTIVDVKMPFLSMVVFMVKVVIASIPAFTILAIIGALTVAILSSLSGGNLGVLNKANQVS